MIMVSKEEMVQHISFLYRKILAYPDHEDEIVELYLKLLDEYTDENFINMKEGLRYCRILLDNKE